MLKISRKNVNSLEALKVCLEQKVCFLTQKFVNLPFCHWRAWRACEGLMIDSIGIAYRDSQFDIMIPWWNLKPQQAISKIKEGYLAINFNDHTPGRGYIIRKASYDTEDLNEENPFALLKGSLVIYRELDLAFTHILKYVEERLLLHLPYLFRDEKSELALKKSVFDRSKLSCCMRLNLSRKYPSFCPITGDESNCMGVLKIKGSDETVAWLLSSKGKKRLKDQKLWRWTALLAAFLGSIFYGAYVFFVLYPQSESWVEVCQQFLCIQSVFLLPFLVTFFTPDAIIFYKEKASDQDVIVQMQRKDYWEAFFELNA